MRQRRLIVLKFGGSVLPDEDSLARAVHEVYRWAREGWSVVAVVSAIDGETDARLRSAVHRAEGGCDHAVAAAVAGGELHSAAQFGLFLERAGVDAAVVNPGGIGLRADGAGLDASPLGVDATPIRRLLDAGRVVVCPGYVATDADGRWMLLGRGGSDLTALVLADALRADRCRLVKDVDGLYDSDPNAPGPRPARYESASWDDALARDGSIIQHKAIGYAKSKRLSFELGKLNGVRPTVVGDLPLREGPPEPPERTPPVRVAILGLGVVGGGVYESVRRLPGVEIVRVAVRDPRKHAGAELPSEIVSTDPIEAAQCEADIVIELLGGTGVALGAVRAALARGARVVTANKALIAAHGEELLGLARVTGGGLEFSASVGGSMPILEHLSAHAGETPRRIRAVLNGTCNFILDALATGRPFHDAVREAQRLGFAEADPRRDLAGFDAADKLVVLAHSLGCTGLTVDDVARQTIGDEVTTLATSAAKNGRVLRQVSELDLTGAEPVASVTLREVDRDDPLHAVRRERNGAVVEWESGAITRVAGRGAGRYPTAESVVADVLGLVRTGVSCELARAGGVA